MLFQFLILFSVNVTLLFEMGPFEETHMSDLWILMAWCFTTKAAESTVLIMQSSIPVIYELINQCVNVNSQNVKVLIILSWLPGRIQPSHKSHYASDKSPTMHHFVTEMCTQVHISVTKWCIVGHGTGALQDLWDESRARAMTAMVNRCLYIFPTCQYI